MEKRKKERKKEIKKERKSSALRKCECEMVFICTKSFGKNKIKLRK